MSATNQVATPSPRHLLNAALVLKLLFESEVRHELVDDMVAVLLQLLHHLCVRLHTPRLRGTMPKLFEVVCLPSDVAPTTIERRPLSHIFGNRH